MIRLVAPLLCVGLVAAPGDVRADVWRVPTQIFTLSGAVDAASPGDTIQVVGNGGATYFVNLTIDKDLTFEGGWRADFLLRDPDVYVSVLRDANGETVRPIFRIEGTPTVVIDGFQVRGGRFGVYAEEGADVVIRNCSFREQQNGTAEPPFGGKTGGAVRIAGGTLLMENVVIEDLLTAFHGAAIGLESVQRAELRDCRIEGCRNLPIIFGIFTPAFGGALYAVDVDDLRLERTDIVFCVSLARGGLGYLERTSFSAVDCDFDRGSGSQRGGAFVLEECPTVSFTDCNFTVNRAVEGGALYVSRNGSLTLDGSTFFLNTPSPNATSPQGGAIWLDSTPFEIRDSRFETNNGLTAGWTRGGGVRCDNSSGTVTGTTFLGELASGRGGAWSQIGGRTVFDGCTFDGNRSGLYGGALHIELAGALEVRNSLFTGNSAKLGGAIAASFTGGVDVDRCTFSGNKGGSAGAALYLDTGAQGDVENSILCCAPRGELIFCGSADIAVRYSDLWNDDMVNVRPEFGGTCEDQIGVNGNIRQDPAFCDPQGPDFHLSATSPCAGTASDQGNMGWAATGCPGQPLSLRRDSWGAIKARYRPR